jgi:dipeptidase E
VSNQLQLGARVLSSPVTGVIFVEAGGSSTLAILKLMKTLFLTSTFSKVAGELTKLLQASIKQQTVAFIPTAGDVYDNKWFVEADRAKLEEMGFRLIDVSLKDFEKESLSETLKGVDIIFVAGGNTFYLLEQARKSGFIDIVPKLVEKGAVYIGSSAGSYLACPTIEVANWKHQGRNIVGLTDLTSLSLVPFLMSVHYKPEYDESLREGIKRTSIPVKILTDDQALIIKGDDVKLVGFGNEVVLN